MAELTDAQLLQEAEIIKNETIAGANTAARIGQFIEDMIRSKVSILAPKLLDASTPGYVWMASDTQGNGSWQPSTGGGGGWPLSGSAVFTGDVDINTGIYGFRLQSNFTETTPITYFDFITGSNLSMGMTSVTRGTQQVINYDRWYVSISDFTKEKKIDINYTTSGIVITDSVNSAGFIYAADYSGGATARWLMDKGYGDSTYLTIANPTYTGVLTTGTLGYSDTGILASLQSSTNSYNQVILQNTSSGSSASTNLIISNNLGTSTTHYLEIGKNSSAFTGSGSFNLANASYIDEASDDLVIGTLSNKALHFVTNGSTTDNMSISGAGNITITQPAQSSGWAPMIIYNPGAHTSLTATTEFISNDFKGTSQQWLAGTVAIQRFNYFRGYTLIGASATATFTNAYTLYVDSPSAGTNAAITNSWAAGFNGDIQLLNLNAGGSVKIRLTPNNGSWNHIIQTSTNFLQIGGNNGSSTGVDITGNNFGMTIVRFQGSGGVTGTGSIAFGSTTTTNAQYYFNQSGLSSSWVPIVRFDAGAHINTTASELFDVNFNLARIVQFTGSTGFATQRAFIIQAPTYAFVSATGTITNAYTTFITGGPVAGTNAAITNSWALGLGGNLRLNGKTTADSDYILTDATKGLVLKDTQGTPHYWRVTVSNVGALVITDLGTTQP